MYQSQVSVTKWMVGGALIGVFSLIVNGIPYDHTVQIISGIFGAVLGGCFIGGITALIINRIRGR